MNLQVESSQEKTIFGHFISVEKDQKTKWDQLERKLWKVKIHSQTGLKSM